MARRYAYNYRRATTRRHIGLHRAVIENATPRAVARSTSFKHVDYGRATQRAREIGGMLSDLKPGT